VRRTWHRASIAPEALNQPRMSATPRRQRAQPQSLPLTPRERGAPLLQRNMRPQNTLAQFPARRRAEQQAQESLP